MKKLLSTILTVTILMSSTSVISAFADKLKNDTTIITEKPLQTPPKMLKHNISETKSVNKESNLYSADTSIEFTGKIRKEKEKLSKKSYWQRNKSIILNTISGQAIVFATGLAFSAFFGCDPIKNILAVSNTGDINTCSKIEKLTFYTAGIFLGLGITVSFSNEVLVSAILQ